MAVSISKPRVDTPASRRRARIKIGSAVGITLLVLMSLFALVPFLWMLSTALKTRAEVFTFPPILIPPEPRWENFARVFEAFPFLKYARNSLFVTITVTIFQTLTSAMAAYAFSRLRFPGRDRLFLLYLGTLMVPSVVTLIPSYILMTERFLGWVDTYKALIVPASLGGAFNTFLIRQFLLSLPVDLEDAARIDGASPLQIFWKLVLPLAKPVLAIVSVFTFMNSWNSFLWPLLMIKNQDNLVLTVGLSAMQGRWGTRWPELMAGTLMSILPILVLLILFQRYFEEGITFTGLKN
ncbi:MAG TPA: carbohydrate ABC transporter permease [Anaerolineales bacterium]|nr:carbohydrate ABC transporter permease [Anaerolineales bacterium]